MFQQLGALAGLLGNKSKIAEEMERFQQQVGQLTAEADAGGGMVTAKVNGKFEVLSVRLSEEAAKLNDREMLEDLIAAAVNQAVNKARQLLSEETSKMAGRIGLPPGLLGGGFPGFGN